MNKLFHGLIFQVYDSQSINGSAPWSEKFHRRQGGGHRIASFLRTNGWDVEVVDFAAQFLLDELKQIAKSRISNTTYFFAFSCIFSSWPNVISQFVDWLKTTYPGIAIIYGGTAWPSVHSPSIDYYITGYGEMAVLKLLKYLTGNATRSSLPFDLRFANRKVISANQSCPAFPLNILSIDYEDRDFLLPDEWTNIELSRGCIFKCKFCNYPVLNVKGDYSQNDNDFYRNIQSNFDRFGIKNYYVVDETFNDRPDKIEKFADAVEQLSFVPFFSGFIRADLLVSRPNDRENLLRMNFLGHHYGIESLHYPSAQSIGKGMHPDKLTEGLVEVKKYFQNNNRKIYRGTMSFIAGLPHETSTTMMATANWLKNHWSDQSAIWFPLSIPDPTQTIHGWTDSVSDISVDFMKFGYHKDESVDKSFLPGDIAWANDHLSYVKCQKFIDVILPTRCKQVLERTTSLTLDEITYPGQSIDNALKNEYSMADQQQSLQYRNHIILNYKQKKLSI
jgi:hypothetical protein